MMPVLGAALTLDMLAFAQRLRLAD